MEIQTAPRSPAPTPWGRLVLSAIVLAPVTLFVLLPIGLGLDRYVMTGGSMGGSLGKGSVAFERVLPASDIRPGDVITYARPGEPDQMVTHRVVSIHAAAIVTRGDAESHDDPWVLTADGPTLSRVEFSVPLVGWVYLFFAQPSGWLATVAAAIALAVLTRRRRGARAALVPEPDVAPLPTEVEMASAMLSDARDTGVSGVKGE